MYYFRLRLQALALYNFFKTSLLSRRREMRYKYKEKYTQKHMNYFRLRLQALAFYNSSETLLARRREMMVQM